MKNKRGILFMAVGLLLLAGAITLTLLNIGDEREAGVQSEQAVETLSAEIPSYTASMDDTCDIEDACDIENEMQTMEIGGKGYIGILDIPALNLSLPIMENWSYPHLKVAPCRYAGSFLDDSMIIAGHNYRSHFGTLYLLEYGDSVVFTDVTGVSYQYEVVSVETLAKTAVDEMTSGDWDLTLFTCTPGGVNRVTVRCNRI